jgi:hypothetical protein
MSTVTALTGFRVRTWEYQGTKRVGMVCNRCGYVVDPPDPAAATQADLEAAAGRHTCPPPIYEWDLWHRRAVAAGVAPELAELGRQVYRENSQHGWGLRIDEERMIRSAKNDPEETGHRWRTLLETDGGLL